MSEIHYFLGSNSSSGFYSLYDGFTDSAKDTLHIIKGFPGSGKSSFIRRIAETMSRAGLDTEYIHCSGDPDSLDGVYFPALRTGYIDGTSPHITEPRIAGASEDYVNLGAFCDTAALADKRNEIDRLTKAYKSLYGRAYSFLSAAASVRAAYAPSFKKETYDKVLRRARSTTARTIGRLRSKGGRTTRRFLGAITCKGYVSRFDTVEALADRVIVVENAYGLAPLYLSAAADIVKKAGFGTVLCLSPQDPENIEHLIVPELRLAFVSSSPETPYTGKATRHIRLDSVPSREELKEAAPKAKASRRISSELTAEAIRVLADAKALHDRLEALFIPLIDFSALYALAYSHSEHLLLHIAEG